MGRLTVRFGTGTVFLHRASSCDYACVHWAAATKARQMPSSLVRQEIQTENWAWRHGTRCCYCDSLRPFKDSSDVKDILNRHLPSSLGAQQSPRPGCPDLSFHPEWRLRFHCVSGEQSGSTVKSLDICLQEWSKQDPTQHRTCPYIVAVKAERADNMCNRHVNLGTKECR
jgi:hypothetical protein